MRALFLLLVLVNLGFFAWANFFAELDAQSDPRPLARQVAPEKLRILPPDPAAKSLPAATVQKPAAEAARSACLEWGGFTVAEAARAVEALGPLAPGSRITQRQTEDTASWWVYISPRANRQDAQKKGAELKGLGIDDYFIVQDEGPMRFAVSLGVFKTEAAAAGHLEALRGKGVKTAQVGARETQLQKTYLQVRSADESLATRLREASQSFAGSEVRECPAVQPIAQPIG
jgi:hypothetical protein